jgi:DNA-binding GntR family transcriptional regulator
VLGVRLAVQRATDEDFARLEAIIRATDREHSPREAAALDLEFHEAVMHAARHKRLLGCWQTLHAQLKLALVQQGMVNPEFGHEVAASHRQLLAELRARNERGAVKIIEDQMEGFRKCARRLTGTESSSP